MTQQTLSSARRIVLALALASGAFGMGCWKPEIDDAEIGCGLDANVNAKCPNRAPVDAPVPGTPDAGVAPDTAPPELDVTGGGDVTAPADSTQAIDAGID